MSGFQEPIDENRRKVISVVVPTCNEVGNIELFVQQIQELFSGELAAYDYEIVVIDNDSHDGTRDVLQRICASDHRVKCIFNIRNFGSIRSGFYGLQQCTGDCAVKIAADFQEPISCIPEMVRKWEAGAPIVVAVKTTSEEQRLAFSVRSLFYKLMMRHSDFEQIDQFTGFGLYGRQFLDVCRSLEDPYPYFRGIVSELGGKWDIVTYHQEERRSGVSKYNLPRLYDYAMLGITSYSKFFLRSATVVAALEGFLAALGVIVTIVLAILRSQATGVSLIITILLFLSMVTMFYVGMLGEYVLSINTRVLKRPLVVEERRFNFE